MSAVDRIAVLTATACGIGNAPFISGTWGSLPGLLVGAAIHVSAKALFFDHNSLLPGLSRGGVGFVVICLLVIIAIAHWSIDRVERLWNTHDDGRIVIDEVAGQAITIAFFDVTLLSLAAGFVLFRLFDIIKPWPISYLDRKVPGSLGTWSDDVLAGIAAAVCLSAVIDFAG